MRRTSDTFPRQDQGTPIRGFWLWVFGLILVTGPHARLFSGLDFSSLSEPSPYYSYFRRLVGVGFLIVLLSRHRVAARVISNSAPMNILILFIVASLLTAVDKVFSAVLFLNNLTMIFAAVAAVSCLKQAQLGKIVAHVLAATVVLCVLSVVLVPHYAVVQSGDLPGSGVPGEWRGMYGSKNALGHVAGIATGALLFAGRAQFRHGFAWAAAVMCGFACMIASHSSSAYAIIIAQGLGAVWVGNRRTLSVSPRDALLAIVAVLIFAFQQQITTLLLGLVGKDASLSGRNIIWQYAWGRIIEVFWTGTGYGYTSSGAFSTLLQEAMHTMQALHFHNGFLDTAYNLGVIGCGLFFWAYLQPVISSMPLELSGQERSARSIFILMLFGWLTSSFTEIDAVRPVSAVASFGLLAAYGLYAARTEALTKRRSLSPVNRHG